MDGNFVSFEQSSGLNCHEAEYIFPSFNIIGCDECNFYLRFNKPCNTPPFQVNFEIDLRRVSPEISKECVIHIKRIDSLFNTVEVTFTLNLTNSTGPVCPAIENPECELGFLQTILRTFQIELRHLKFTSFILDPVNIKSHLRVVDCHRNKRERDVSPYSDESCSRSSKQSKI